jgi:2-polyprenyl-3-methyl-5-hydroxy-6-metoxy-1,4-benzoquinol methylase
LDVGFGNGANSSVLKGKYPQARFDGITVSEEELAIGRKIFGNVWLYNIENGVDNLPSDRSYDVIIASHVLEHLRYPDECLRSLATLLKPGGYIVIAVPNILFYSQRFRFLKGSFDYTDTGVMDRTHLKFFTFNSIEAVLDVAGSGLKKVLKIADSKIPFLPTRRISIFDAFNKKVDNMLGPAFPNLFAWQIIIKLQKV